MIFFSYKISANNDKRINPIKTPVKKVTPILNNFLIDILSKIIKLFNKQQPRKEC